MPVSQPVSTRTNTVMREEFYDEFLTIHNSRYRNIENRDSYSIPGFDQGLLDGRHVMNEIPHHSEMSRGQFDNNLKFRNVFQCHFCGSYQRNLKGRELPANSSSVPFKCNECIETMKLKENSHPCPKFAEVSDGRSSIKLHKLIKAGDKRCLYREHSFDRIVSEILDYNFGNIAQEIPATISHSAEGADNNTLALTNQTSTFQSSTFPRSIIQERHWNVNSTASTDVRCVSSNTVQNENSDYFNSSQLIPAAQHFENSDYTYGAENPAMAFSTAASTTTLKPFEPTCQNNSAWMQHSPNLSFYNQLPPTSQGIEDPSKYITIYDPTNEYYNISMQSGQSSMQDSEISRFQDKEYQLMAIARKSDRREENTKCASDLSSPSINVQYHGNSRPQKSIHMAAFQRVSTSTNTMMREKEFLNIQNSAYRNIENIDSYSIPDSGKGFLDCRQGMNEIPHNSYKSQGQLADNLKFQNVFQCHFCGSYQRDLKGRNCLQIQEAFHLNAMNVLNRRN
ncbi:hypothetical protein CEXT_5281 [Caerostris extrusa]|uniref:Uncharacterized protein n=1 Tax=Caerostris extrusa TaxID=172846 RepID=A0AAV4XYB1_CAEEX|nr:hypothetical protein CEXT_5281 [Caerostris extrusa]